MSAPQPPRTAKLIRWWDPLAALLLFAALLTAASRLWATTWTPDLSLIQEMTLIGLVLGLALGQSRFAPGWCALLALLYGLFFSVWRMAATMVTGIPDWSDRLMRLWERLRMVVVQLNSEEEIFDHILFLVLMTALFWAFSIYSGYSLTRYAAPWRIVLPAGAAVLVFQVYDKLVLSRSWYLAAYILFALLLVGRLTYLHNLHGWKETRTYISPEVSFDLMRFTLLLVVFVVALAWVLPVAARPFTTVAEAWQDVREYFRPIEDRFDRLFAGLRATVGIVTESYGSEMLLGRGSPLSERTVFTVEASPRPAVSAPYYWRARSYDEYLGNGGWEANTLEKQRIEPDAWTAGLTLNSQLAVITIRPEEPLLTLFAPAATIWFDVPVEGEFFTGGAETLDASTWRAPDYVWSGDRYQLRAAMSAATVAALRTASREYPDYIRERYLQVPETVTQRTRDLAAQLGEGQLSAYDTAEAVTNYLRENIQYTEVVEGTPAGQEVLDWFLFDYKQGFCNYYATAEVILLRLNGIPARLAVGYAQGERLIDETAPALEGALETYIVRSKHSHAWPEVYFPEIGWVEFEPTVSISPIVRPSGETAPQRPPSDLPDDLQEETGISPEPLTPEPLPENTASPSAPIPPAVSALRRAAPILLIVAGLLVAAWLILQPLFPARLRAGMRRMGLQPPAFLNRWEQFTAQRPPFIVWLAQGMRRAGLRPPRWLRQWADLTAASPLTRSYIEINRALTRLGHPPAVVDTPAERVTRLVEILPYASEPAWILLHEYQIATYSPAPADLSAARRAGREIRRISLLVKLQKILSGSAEAGRERQ